MTTTVGVNVTRATPTITAVRDSGGTFTPTTVPAFGFALDLASPAHVTATTVDERGNVYLTGTFQGTVNFNPSGTTGPI